METLDSLLTWLSQNNNALYLGLFGFLAVIFTKIKIILSYPINMILKLTTTTLETDNSSWNTMYGYEKLMRFIEKNNPILSNHIKPDYNSYDKTNTIVAGSGYSAFFYKRHLFIVATYFHEKELTTYYSTRITLLSKNKAILNDFILEAWEMEQDVLSVKLCNRDGDWGVSASTTTRLFDTIAINTKMRESIFTNYDLFFDHKEAYLKRGLPWKNNMCLYGPPGTGKTSIIKAIASKYNLDIYYININTITDDGFITAISNIPVTGLLVLEDIDSNKGLHNRERVQNSEETKNSTNTLSLQTLLNTLDGILTPTGLKAVITTNHIDKLDKAILRAGRTDTLLEIKPLDCISVELYLTSLLQKPISLKGEGTILGSKLSTITLMNYHNEANLFMELEKYQLYKV